MTATSAPAANECEATCPCRFVPPIADPCSCGMYEKGTRCPFCEVVVGGVTAKQPREQSKAEILAEYDRRMEAALAGTPPVNPTRRTTTDASPAATSGTSTTDGSAGPPSADASSTAPRPKGRRPRKPRRTALQMQRAAEQEVREAALRVSRATRGTFLEGALEEEDRWAASLRAADER